MATDRTPQLLEQLAEHARRDDLARLVHSAVLGAALSSNGSIDQDALRDEAAKLEVVDADAETPSGNVLDVLRKGPAKPAERTLLAVLFAHAVNKSLVSSSTPEADLAAVVAWLGNLTLTGVKDKGSEVTRTLSGEDANAPRGPVVTALLAMTGVLLLKCFVELTGRYVLARKSTSEARILPDGGLVIRARTEMFGRLLREKETLLPRDALQRATREVRFPSVAMYAGLFALVLGSYVGVGLVTDGVRATSPSLLAMGILFVLAGLGLDFALTSLLPGKDGRCRVFFLPRRGKAVCLGAVDREEADRFLAELAKG